VIIWEHFGVTFASSTMLQDEVFLHCKKNLEDDSHPVDICQALLLR